MEIYYGDGHVDNKYITTTITTLKENLKKKTQEVVIKTMKVRW